MRNPQETREAPSRALLGTALLLSLVLVLVSIRLQPPRPLGADSPEDGFSAIRAQAHLQEILGDGEPHPVASDADTRVRERLVGVLQGLGLSAEIQEAFTCGDLGPTCAPVVNVLARIPGREPEPAVLLVSHYDSVPAGPGAADDGASVAAMLEIARALLQQPPRRHPVLLLFDEGEEVGLLGAEAFLEHPLAAEVAVVVNLEARGTSGLSIMFETSDDNAWMLDAYARSVRRPAASSVSYEVYRRLPNDTDLTVFERAGRPGMNFAFIEEVAHYHTPLDSLESLDLGSLQHQGESALGVVRALADSDLSRQPPTGNSVYADLLGLTLIRWPEPWSLPVAAVPLVALIVAATGAIRTGRCRSGAPLWGFAFWLGTILLATVAGIVLTWLLKTAAGVPRPWLAHPVPTRVALWAVAVAASVFTASLFAGRARFWGLALGAWLGWALLGVAAAASLPGASIVFVVPALVATSLLALAAWLPPGWGAAAVAAGTAVAGAVWFPLALLLESSFGLEGSPGVTGPVALVATGAAPLLATASRRWRVAGAVATGAVLCASVTLLLPPVSRLRPQALNIVYLQDADTGTARWVVGGPRDGVPDALRSAAALHDEAVGEVFPWSGPGDLRYVGVAPTVALQPPELAVLEEIPEMEARRIRARIRSSRGARSVLLFVPKVAAIRSVAVGGRPARPRSAGPDYLSLNVQGIPAGGIELDLVLADPAPVELLLLDRSEGLPEVGRQIVEARPPWAVPRHQGDVTIVQRRVRL